MRRVFYRCPYGRSERRLGRKPLARGRPDPSRKPSRDTPRLSGSTTSRLVRCPGTRCFASFTSLSGTLESPRSRSPSSRRLSLDRLGRCFVRRVSSASVCRHRERAGIFEVDPFSGLGKRPASLGLYGGPARFRRSRSRSSAAPATNVCDLRARKTYTRAQF